MGCRDYTIRIFNGGGLFFVAPSEMTYHLLQMPQENFEVDERLSPAANSIILSVCVMWRKDWDS